MEDHLQARFMEAVAARSREAAASGKPGDCTKIVMVSGLSLDTCEHLSASLAARGVYTQYGPLPYYQGSPDGWYLKFKDSRGGKVPWGRDPE